MHRDKLSDVQPPPHIESTPTVSEMGVKTKTQLLAERTVLRQLITSVIAASADKDLNPKGTCFPMLFTRVSGPLEPGHTAHFLKCCVVVMLIIRVHGCRQGLCDGGLPPLCPAVRHRSMRAAPVIRPGQRAGRAQGSRVRPQGARSAPLPGRAGRCELLSLPLKDTLHNSPC